MRRRTLAIIFIFSALLSLGAIVWLSMNYTSITISKIEIADTTEKQERGLMNRTDLCRECGMLFEFYSPRQVSFWMKDTPLPLDIIMMTESGRITDIHRHTKPYDQSQLPSSSPVKYVLEVNAGVASDLMPGQRVNIKQLQSLAR